MKEATYITFWDIISNCRIEIPIIQRDYTYGRESAKAIKKKIIEDIYSSLNESANSPLHLDFIYGKLLGKENHSAFERNKSNINSLLKTIQSYASDLDVAIKYSLPEKSKEDAAKITFIPLDGQQRLTTLFLLHWYLVQKLGRKDELAILNKFSYATRVGAKDFCQLITTTFFTLPKGKGLLSETICNSESYFSDWNKDPTVRSMLSVINELDRVFKNALDDLPRLWDNLVLNNRISFDFFDLDDFELTDELYIKMNARGKKLSEFEKFKAWLIKDFKQKIQITDWTSNFDIKWTDLFWSCKDSSQSTIDDQYLNFFRSLFLRDYLKYQKDKSKNINYDNFKEQISMLREVKSNPLSLFQETGDKLLPLLIEQRINEYLALLDVFDKELIESLDEGTLFLDKYINKALSKFLFNIEDLEKDSWWDLTLRYAILGFLEKQKKWDEKSLIQWIRVISNLIYNTPIDSPRLYIDATESIEKILDLLAGQSSVYNVLQTLNAKDIQVLSNRQLKEEIEKSKLIVEEKNWEVALLETENNKYFYGQIGFLFNLIDDKSSSLEDFKSISKKVCSLFSNAVLDNKTYLLVRAFLSQGDCFIKEGQNLVFYSNIHGTLRERNENWRRFFRQKIDFIKKIIEHPLYETDNVVTSLKNIIVLELPTIQEEYLKKFVRNAKLLEYAKKRCIRKYTNGYYILSTTRIAGYYVELFSYDWYLRNKKFDCDYIAVKGEGAMPFIKLDLNNKEYYILYDEDLNNFKVEDKNEDLIQSFKSINSAINNISKL